MKTSKLLLGVASLVLWPLLSSELRGAESYAAYLMNQEFTGLQQRYLQGRISAGEYERLKYQAFKAEVDAIERWYTQGQISRRESDSLSDEARQQYSTAFLAVTPDELARLQPTFERPELASVPRFASRTGPPVALDELERRYFQGRISARQYEQMKLERKQREEAEIEEDYYRGHLSAQQARTLEQRLDAEYARLSFASPGVASTEPANVHAPDSGLSARRQERNQVAPTGSPTGRQYPVPAARSKAQQLDDLLKLYRDDKITPREYQEERVRILALPGP